MVSPEDRNKSVQLIVGERRAKARYPIALDVSYKVLKRREVDRTGTGRTVNISSKGVLLQTDQLLVPGARIELSMKWPVLLQGVCGMKLVVSGRIIRCHGKSNMIAVRTNCHEFRTAGVRSVQALLAHACATAG